MAEWLRGPLSDEMSRCIEKTASETGVLDRDALREAWESHRSGKENHEQILWATFAFARWARSTSTRNGPS